MSILLFILLLLFCIGVGLLIYKYYTDKKTHLGYAPPPGDIYINFGP